MRTFVRRAIRAARALLTANGKDRFWARWWLVFALGQIIEARVMSRGRADGRRSMSHLHPEGKPLQMLERAGMLYELRKMNDLRPAKGDGENSSTPSPPGRAADP